MIDAPVSVFRPVKYRQGTDLSCRSQTFSVARPAVPRHFPRSASRLTRCNQAGEIVQVNFFSSPTRKRPFGSPEGR